MSYIWFGLSLMPLKKKRVIPRKDYFITTIPVIRPCARCGVWLAAGIAEGIHVTVDLTALDAEQAIFAMLLKLDLYCLTRTGLVHLYRERFEDPRFASRLPEHRCGVPWISKLPPGGAVMTPVNSDIPPY